MHHCFGVFQFDENQAGSDLLERAASRFPSTLGRGRRYTGHGLQIAGDVRRSVVDGVSELYCCGEFYGQEITVETLHRQIEQKGFQSATSELNGRFILGYLDLRHRKFHLATDHLGVQQVLYCRTGRALVFASSLQFLLTHPDCPREIDWAQALRRPVPFVVLDGERSQQAWFRDVFLLEGGTSLSLAKPAGQIEKQAYWNPYEPGFDPYDQRSARTVMQEYMDLLEDAVRIRIQDSPTACSFLSGGLDSSVICALAARMKPLQTFSIITQTTLLEETTDACFRLAEDLRFRNTQVAIPYHRLNFSAALWKKQVWRAESPFNHTDSFTKTMLHDAVRRMHPEIGYTLTGTGSDQLNGGLARWIVEDAGSPETNWQSLMDKVAENELRSLIPERWHALWGARRLLTPEFVAGFSGRAPEPNPWMFYVKSNLHLNQFVLLWDENRAAAAHGHSARYPFLDHRFVRFIAQIPERLHGELFYDKQILRQPAARLLPDYILQKPKAPADTGRYDHRFQLYQSLIHPGNLDLLEEALGPIDQPHPVIDKKALVDQVGLLCQHPDHFGWQYLLNVINLGLLEKLPEQDEASMAYEDELQPFLEIVQDATSSNLDRLRKRMDIIPEPDLLEQPVRFNDGCSLVIEHRTQKMYLNKQESLAYELEPENRVWCDFLLRIDGEQSANTILAEISGDFEDIREYFYLCMKENILRV